MCRRGMVACHVDCLVNVKIARDMEDSYTVKGRYIVLQ